MQEDGSEHADDEEDNDSEEEREEVKELPTGDNSDVHSQATTMLTTSSKYKSESMVETNLDREFFVLQQQTNIQELKLNKGEKRALKFALKKGINISEIPNLKAYLEEQVMIAKIRKNVKTVISDASAKAKKSDKYSRGNNNSNKFYVFTQYNEDGMGGGGHNSD